jgi:serine/threonine-protein kinase
MSYFHEQSGYIWLLFGGGNWTWDIEDDGVCPESGATTHVKSTVKYPLPQSPQNPITLLTGHGRHEQSAPCALTVDFDETSTRTGD